MSQQLLDDFISKFPNDFGDPLALNLVPLSGKK